MITIFGITLLSGDIWLKFLIAVVCATAIGLERNYKNKPVGVRTCNLVTIGAMIFIILGHSFGVTAGDPTRTLGQIIVALGWLGAGGIFKDSNNTITGMTSGAVIWILAAIGCAIGLGLYQLALVTTGFVGFVLFTAGKLEHKFKNWMHD